MKRFASIKKAFKTTKKPDTHPAPTVADPTPVVTLEHIYATSPANTLVKFIGPPLVLIDTAEQDKLEITTKAALILAEFERTLGEAILEAQVPQRVVEARFVPLLNISSGTDAEGMGSFEILGSEAFWAAARIAAQGMGTSEWWGEHFALIVRWKVAVERKPLPVAKPGPGDGVRWPFLGYQ